MQKAWVTRASERLGSRLRLYMCVSVVRTKNSGVAVKLLLPQMIDPV
jgi:hypothetical protein